MHYYGDLWKRITALWSTMETYRTLIYYFAED